MPPIRLVNVSVVVGTDTVAVMVPAPDELQVGLATVESAHTTTYDVAAGVPNVTGADHATASVPAASDVADVMAGAEGGP